MVGDVVIVERDEQVPCDIVLLYSSDENKSVWVDTANLDGESSLKPKIPLCGTLREEDFPQYQEQIGSSGFFCCFCLDQSIIPKRLEEPYSKLVAICRNYTEKCPNQRYSRLAWGFRASTLQN